MLAVDYAPDALVVSDINTARVSAYELDALELSTGGRVDVTTDGAHAALTLACQADPLVTDIAAGGAASLIAGTAIAPTVVAAPTVGATASGQISARVAGVVETATPATFNASLLPGFPSGFPPGTASSLSTTAAGDTAVESGDTAIRQAATGRARYEAAAGHVFAVGGRDVFTVSPAAALVDAAIDIDGTLNRIGVVATDMRVEDKLVMLGVGETDAAGDDSGIQILSAPVAASDVAYLSRFTDADGQPVFVAPDGSTVDTERVAASGLFRKRVVNSAGPRALEGERSAAARRDGPAWQIENGSLCLTHVVPVGPGIARRYTVALRITDLGHFEFVRTTVEFGIGVQGNVSPNTTPEIRVLKRFVPA